MIFWITFVVFIVVVYIYYTRNFNYWKNKGVKYEKPIIFLGSEAALYLKRRSATQLTGDVYRRHPHERVVGTFRAGAPELLLRDPELVRRVLAADAAHFQHRRPVPIDLYENEPSKGHLLNLNGDLWKVVRQRLTPAFSSAKLKAMFPLIAERASRLRARIAAAAGAPLDARDLMARFTTDFIGACAFGLDMDALTDENSAFRTLGTEIFNISVGKFMLKEFFPGVFKNLKVMPKEAAVGVESLVRLALERRNYEPSGRNDFIDLLLECKKRGRMVTESIERVAADGSPETVSFELTDELLAAQVFVFFAAGFETSSSATSYALHLLAYHPHAQRKAQAEVDAALARHGRLSYEAVREMRYLECAFKETMRIFPAIGRLARRCNKTYTFPDLDLTIDKGVMVNIPIEAMQNDPKYFENPEEFRPERFDPGELDSEKIKFVYLPFGDGPRSCIGDRLGLMQSLAGLAAVLAGFSVQPAPASRRHPRVDANPIAVQTISAGLPLIFRERNKER